MDYDLGTSDGALYSDMHISPDLVIHPSTLCVLYIVQTRVSRRDP